MKSGREVSPSSSRETGVKSGREVSPSPSRETSVKCEASTLSSVTTETVSSVGYVGGSSSSVSSVSDTNPVVSSGECLYAGVACIPSAPADSRTLSRDCASSGDRYESVPSSSTAYPASSSPNHSEGKAYASSSCVNASPSTFSSSGQLSSVQPANVSNNILSDDSCKIPSLGTGCVSTSNATLSAGEDSQPVSKELPVSSLGPATASISNSTQTSSLAPVSSTLPQPRTSSPKQQDMPPATLKPASSKATYTDSAPETTPTPPTVPSPEVTTSTDSTSKATHTDLVSNGDPIPKATDASSKDTPTSMDVSPLGISDGLTSDPPAGAGGGDEGVMGPPEGGGAVAMSHQTHPPVPRYNLYHVMYHTCGEGAEPHWKAEFDPLQQGLEMLGKYIETARGPLKGLGWDYSRAVDLVVKLKRGAAAGKT